MAGALVHQSIVEEIQKVLDSDKEISQPTKDRLILMTMKSLFEVIEGKGGIKDRLEYLEKYKPYLQALAFIAAAFALALVGAIVAGRIHMEIIP